MRHIVDVDGQLLAIDAELIDARSLLGRANRPSDFHLYQVRAGERFRVGPNQLITLSEKELLYFQTFASTALPMAQLAA
jgi:hypothetical protein